MRRMCELLGMECNVPTDIVFSFSGLALRGGLRGPHSDGWGLALYEGKAVRTFLEPEAAARSPLAEFVRNHPVKTLLAVAHVRLKTRGRATLENTHPFVRELWGRSWVFAHNGTVRGAARLPLGRFRPVGNTDSERAFCAILARLEGRFSEFPRSREGKRALWQAVADAGAEVGARGSFNFLLADGEHLFARCATKLHAERHPEVAGNVAPAHIGPKNDTDRPGAPRGRLSSCRSRAGQRPARGARDYG